MRSRLLTQPTARHACCGIFSALERTRVTHPELLPDGDTVAWTPRRDRDADCGRCQSAVDPHSAFQAGIAAPGRRSARRQFASMRVVLVLSRTRQFMDRTSV